MGSRWFLTMRVLRAVLLPGGLGYPEFTRIPSCWAECAVMLPFSCEAPLSLRLSKDTHFSFSQGH